MSSFIDKVLAQEQEKASIQYFKSLTGGRSLFGTIQNLYQSYEVETFDVNGKPTIQTFPYAQYMDLLNQPAFSEESASSLGITQLSEARLLESSTISKDDAQKVLQDAVKVDYLISMRSEESLPVDYNTLQTPTMEIEMEYNFYDPDELTISRQEDQSKDPLLFGQDPPRCVHLTWDPTNVIHESKDFKDRTTQEKTMVGLFLSDVRGTATLTNSKTANPISSNNSKTAKIYRDGQPLALVDTHDLSTGFNSTSNSRLFKNCSMTIMNTNGIDVNSVKFSDILLDDLNG